MTSPDTDWNAAHSDRAASRAINQLGPLASAAAEASNAIAVPPRSSPARATIWAYLDQLRPGGGKRGVEYDRALQDGDRALRIGR